METAVGLSQLAGLFCNKVLSFWNEDQVLQKWAGGDGKSCVWGPAPKRKLIFPDPGHIGSHITPWPRVSNWKWRDEEVLGRAVSSSVGIAGNQKSCFLGKQCLCSGLYSLHCSFNRNVLWICCEQKGVWNVGLCAGLVCGGTIRGKKKSELFIS